MSAPDEWIDLCGLDELEEGRTTLRKVGARRFACVRQGNQVHALDDRCPHQGYPLSQGSALGGVLTCSWHNWKFELATGTCVFGGDAARRYPARIEGGRVKLDVAEDLAATAERAARGLREGLAEGDVTRVVREGLRLGAARPGPAALGVAGPAFAEAAMDAADRAPWGFGHDLSAMADLASFVTDGRLDAGEALAAAATLVGEIAQARPRRPATAPAAAEGDVVRALLEERRDEAEALARRAARAGGMPTAVDALAPFVARDLFDYGHGAIHTAKALELGDRFPDAAESLAASITVMLGWATAETRLPPFTATRRALDALGDRATGDAELAAEERAQLEAAILEGERPGVEATVRHLQAGADPRALLFAAAHAAASRVLRFDRAWESRADAQVGLLDVTHAVTFAEAALALTKRPAFAAHAHRFAVQAAGFVGKLRRADGPEPSPRQAVDLAAALAARDLAGALGATRDLDRTGRAASFRDLAPFATHDAFVRPIFMAHGIKMLEALRRLDADDGGADDGTYLAALLATVVPLGKERRLRGVAHVAGAFLENGRPPEGLY